MFGSLQASGCKVIPRSVRAPRPAGRREVLAGWLSFYLNSLRASLPHPARILLPGFFPPRDPSVMAFPRLLGAWRAGPGPVLCCSARMRTQTGCLFPRRSLCGAETQARQDVFPWLTRVSRCALAMLHPARCSSRPDAPPGPMLLSGYCSFPDTAPFRIVLLSG